MIKILLSSIFILAMLASFGQNKFYVNCTLITAENRDKCWPITPTNNLIYDSLTQIGLSISKAEINDNCLVIRISFGCGCGSVYMKLFSKWKTFNDEKVLQLIPDFLDYDLCRANCTRKISFDLSPYIQKYPKPFKLIIENFEFIIE